MAQYEDEFAHKFTTSGGDAVSRQFGNIANAAGKAGDVSTRMKDMFAVAGPRIQQAGEGLLRFSEQSRAAYRQGEYVGTQLKNMLSQRGYGDAEYAAMEKLAMKMGQVGGIAHDATEQAMAQMLSYGMMPADIANMMPQIAMQADLMKVPLENVANSIGKAYGSGNFGILKRFGITLDYQAMQQIKAADAMAKSEDPATALAGKQKALAVVIQSLTQYTVPLEQRMDTVRGRQERLADTTDRIKEVMGEGAQSVRFYGDSFKYSLLAPLMEGHDGMLKAAGAGSELGGQLITGAGKVGSFVKEWREYHAIIAMGKKAKEGLTVATKLDSAAEAAKTGIAGKEADALGRVGEQADKNVRKLGSLQKAGSWLTGGMGFGGLGRAGGAGIFGATGMLGANPATLLSGGAGAGAALTSVTLVAGTAILGWEVGAAISKWLDKETGYVDKGATGMEWVNEHLNPFKVMEQGAGNDAEAQSAAIWARHRARAAATTTPGGDLTVTIPGEQVLTKQGTADFAALRG